MKSESQSSGKVVVTMLIAMLVLGAGLATLVLNGDGQPDFNDAGAPALEDVVEDVPERDQVVLTQPDTDKAEPLRTSKASSGVISGRVAVAAELASKIEVFRVRIEEAVNDEGGSTRKVRQFEETYQLTGTVGRFRLANVPFSDFGWRVTAFTPEALSNSQDTVVQLSPERPSQDVSLKLGVPSPLNILLKNQDRGPVAKMDITLDPIGRPHGRRQLRGKSDAYGQWIIEKIQSGRYKITVGPRLSPVIPHKEITIKGDGLQYERITVPRGGSFEFQVVGPSGFPLAGVEISAVARDLRLYKKYEATSNKRGKATLQHVTPGLYYVHFTKKGYTREFEKVEIVEKPKKPEDAKRRVRLQFAQ